MRMDKNYEAIQTRIRKAEILFMKNKSMANQIARDLLPEIREAGFDLLIGRALIILANFNKDNNHYEHAFDLNLQAHRHFELADCVRGTAIVYSNISSLLRGQGKNEEALEYCLKSLELKKQQDDRKGLAKGYTQLAAIHGQMENYDQSLEYSQQAIELNRKGGWTADICMNLSNMGASLIKMERFKDAADIMQEAISMITDDLEDPQSNIHTYVVMGLCQQLLHKPHKALEFVHRAERLLNKSHFKNHNQQVYAMLSELYEEIGEYHQALKFQKIHGEVYKKDVQANNAQKFAEMQARFKVDQKKKEAEIERLKNTELKKAYEDLKAAQDELVRKEKMATLGEIAQQMAHEVQNPLNFVNNFSGLLPEIVEELKASLDESTFSPETEELIRQLTATSKKVKNHGDDLAGIVKKLLKRTWEK